MDNRNLRIIQHLERKHGKPWHAIEGTIYRIHYEEPTLVMSVSSDYGADGTSAGPITHYVGWTQQSPASRRIRDHHSDETSCIVDLSTGTMNDEQTVKMFEVCAVCRAPYLGSLM